jgi:hypothetical protein
LVCLNIFFLFCRYYFYCSLFSISLFF